MNHSDFYDVFFKKIRHKINFTTRILIHEILNCVKKTDSRGNPDFRILELGCGRGLLAAKLLRFGKVKAVDLAEKTIEDNRKFYPEIEFEVADLSKPIRFDTQFDMVVSMEVIEHLPYNLQEQLIKNAYDSLKTGGHLILTTPNKTAQQEHKIKLFQPIEDHLTVQEIEKLVAKYFVIINIFTVIYRFKSRFIDILWKRLFYFINIYWFQNFIKKKNCGLHTVVFAKKAEIS
ncbi:MAG: class I SAM-dependent methyltransferase [Phycisphaerae bacterium]|jgi:2-polyprenyl-3-methyl-5-hydroxy-6-metoxy-1,4-benzoquinol methylase